MTLAMKADRILPESVCRQLRQDIDRYTGLERQRYIRERAEALGLAPEDLCDHLQIVCIGSTPP